MNCVQRNANEIIHNDHTNSGAHVNKHKTTQQQVIQFMDKLEV